MKYGLLAVTMLLAIPLIAAPEPAPFEIHAVAVKGSEHTKEYAETQRDQPPEVVLLDTTVLLDQTALLQASVEQEQGGTAIRIKLTPEGGKRFGEISAAYLNKRVGIVLYGRLYCSPVIRSQILCGDLEIVGNFAGFEAIELVHKLNQSAVPQPYN